MSADLAFATVAELGAAIRSGAVSPTELALRSSGAARHRWALAQCGGNPDARTRAGRRAQGGGRAGRGGRPGTAPRDPVRRQGLAGDRGLPHQLGSGAVPRSAIRTGRRGGPAAGRVRGGALRQALPGRDRGRVWLRAAGRGLQRARYLRLGIRFMGRWLVQRVGVGGRRRAASPLPLAPRRGDRSSAHRRSMGSQGCGRAMERCSRDGAMALSWTMDKIGPMCRTAADCELVLNAISERVDWTQIDRAHAPFKVAVLAGSTDEAQPEVATNFAAALDVARPISRRWKRFRCPRTCPGTRRPA